MVATTIGTGGMKLYIDGELEASSTNTASETFSNGGWWRFGCGNLSGWTSTSGTDRGVVGPERRPPPSRTTPSSAARSTRSTVWQNRVLTDCRGGVPLLHPLSRQRGGSAGWFLGREQTRARPG